jgi:hypothetical protein
MVGKETTELINWIGDVGRQFAEVAPDGIKTTELTQFFDELVASPSALKGIAEKAREEAGKATPEQIEELFNAQYQKLLNTGVKPKAAKLISTGLEMAYLGFALSAEPKDQ